MQVYFGNQKQNHPLLYRETNNINKNIAIFLFYPRLNMQKEMYLYKFSFISSQLHMTMDQICHVTKKMVIHVY